MFTQPKLLRVNLIVVRTVECENVFCTVRMHQLQPSVHEVGVLNMKGEEPAGVYCWFSF